VTKFQVLAKRKTETAFDPGWNEHSEQEAHNADAAIRAAYMKSSDRVLAMVAIPARSWKPTPIRIETVTKVVLGDTLNDERKLSEAGEGK